MTGQVHANSIAADFVPRRFDSLSSVEIDGEGLVFDEGRGVWHLLNPMAQIIWNCCDGTGPIEEIARDMSDAFDEDYDTVLGGVLDTVRQFGDQGLLAGVEPAASAEPHSHGHNHGYDSGAKGPEEGNEPRFLPVPPSS